MKIATTVRSGNNASIEPREAMTRARIDTATAFFVKCNAFFAAQKILTIDEKETMADELLTLGWEALYDLAGYARPTERWTGR